VATGAGGGDGGGPVAAASGDGQGRGRSVARAVWRGEGGAVVHSGGGRLEAKNGDGGSELGHGGHGDPAQGSGTPAASKASKARAREREGVGEDVGARSYGRGGLTRWERQRRRELHSVAAMAAFVRAARERERGAGNEREWREWRGHSAPNSS
jgi:hypothetical protein